MPYNMTREEEQHAAKGIHEILRKLELDLAMLYNYGSLSCFDDYAVTLTHLKEARQRLFPAINKEEEI